MQRSADGKEYEQVGRVEGQGTTYVGHAYSFEDDQPLSGGNYYRLCQVDFDGSKAYYGPVAVKTKAEWRAYPTIVSDRLYLQQYQGGAFSSGQILHCSMTDAQGRCCLQTALLPNASSDYAVELETLSTGAYFLH